MSLRNAARKAYLGEHEDDARAALVNVLGDPEGYVSALTVEYLATAPAYTLTVFTDGDIRLGVRTYPDGRTPWVGLVGFDGSKWSQVVAVESLAHLGKLLPKYDPVDENALPPTWEAGVAYSVGDSVSYNGAAYECLQAHTSQATWEPPNAPSLWAVA